MKRVYSFIIALLMTVASVVCAQADVILKPVAGKSYMVKHSSGYYLTKSGSGLKIMSGGSGDSQMLTFELSENAADVYRICFADGSYIYSDTGWTAYLTTDPSSVSNDLELFSFYQSYSDDYIVIYNEGRGGYLGTDANSDGSSVYTNKSGTDGKHLWKIVEATGELDATISSAETLLADAVVGSSVGQYPQSAVDALSQAITVAKGSLSATLITDILNAVNALTQAMSEFKSEVIAIAIDPAKQYYLQLYGTSNVLTKASKLMVTALAYSDEQILTFVPVDEGTYTYNIRFADGTYALTTGSYDTTYGNSNSAAESQWTFSLADSDEFYYNIKGARGMLGVDNTTSGSTVYSDKSDGVNARWKVVEYNANELETTGLEEAIAQAQATLLAAAIGTLPMEYPQSAADALTSAIEAAQVALSATTQSEINTALTVINAAITAFENSQIIFLPADGKKYYIVQNSTDMVLAINSNIAVVQSPNGTVNQVFDIVPYQGSTKVFNLLTSDNVYLTRTGGWNTTLGTDPDADEAIWEFVIYDFESGLYRIKKYETSGYFGTDSTNENSTVYTNKGSVTNAIWYFMEYDEGEVMTGALDKAIAEAAKLLATAVVGTGNWEYPQEAYDALAEALAAAQAATPITQSDVNEVTAALNAAIATFENSANEPRFIPEEGRAYRYSVQKYNAKFMTNIDGSAKTTVAYEAGNEDQHWIFEAVASTDNAYILRTGSLMLNYDASVTAYDAATADLWTTAYTTTINYVDRFALVRYDAPTKVITFGSGTTWSEQTLDATNTAHQGRFLIVDSTFDANLATLEENIARAAAILASVDRGNAIGQYSDRKCENFQALIDEARTFMNGKTQDEVDEQAETIYAATTTFLNNPNTIIKDDFDDLMVEGRQKVADAEVGVEPGQYYMTQIQDFSALLDEYEKRAGQTSEQDEMDALTEEFREAVEGFKGNAETQVAADVLNDFIIWAELLYEAEKDNVGDNKGQRLQQTVDSYASAIAKAKTVGNDATVLDLEALIAAYNAFLADVVAVDRTSLRNTIAKAQDDAYQNLVGGEYNGNYSVEAISEFADALASAVAADADMTKTQEEINAANTALNTAMTNLAKSMVTISFTALDSDIATARTAIDGLTDTTELGESLANLRSAVTAAEAIDRDRITQSEVDTMASQIAALTATLSAKVIEVSGLADTIAMAEAALGAAETGFKPGNYPSNAIAGLEAAVEAATDVLNNSASTQADLLSAKDNLIAAIATFDALQVATNDTTELEQAIVTVETWIAMTGYEDANLARALAAAKDIVANPDDYTASQVKAALTDLESALDLAKYLMEQSGMLSITANQGLTIDGNHISAASIQGAMLRAYDLNGRMVAAGAEIDLPKGIYIVTLQVNGSTSVEKISIK